MKKLTDFLEPEIVPQSFSRIVEAINSDKYIVVGNRHSISFVTRFINAKSVFDETEIKQLTISYKPGEIAYMPKD